MVIEYVSFVIGAALFLVMLKLVKWGETFDSQLMINIELNFVQILNPIQILSSASS